MRVLRKRLIWMLDFEVNLEIIFPNGGTGLGTEGADDRDIGARRCGS